MAVLQKQQSSMKKAAAAKEAPKDVPVVAMASAAGVTDEADDSEASSLSATVQSESVAPRRKIPANPPAGDVHRREQGAPWRAPADDQIRQANDKAREEQAEKRRWGLAKQVQDGLMHNYSINYGVAELAALLKEGTSLKAQGKTDLSSTEVACIQLLVAAEKYDLKQVVALLDKFPKGRNAGQKAKTKA